MSRNDEIEDFDFQDIFLALDRHIRYKIYSTSDSEASVPSSSSSITSARAACLLLTLRVSRTGSKIASFRSRGPAGPSLPWIQYLITDKDRKATTTNHIFEAWTLILYSVCHSGTSLFWSGFQLQYANHNIIPYSCTCHKAKKQGKCKQTVANTILITNISNINNIKKIWIGIFTCQGHIIKVY